jgi:hypothetical protein
MTNPCLKLIQITPDPLFWVKYIDYKRKNTKSVKADTILFSMAKTLYAINHVCQQYPVLK